MHIWERLGKKPQELLDRTVDGLLSFAKYTYIPETNKARPMFTDGTDLTGFALRRNGYFGNGPVSIAGKAGDVFVHYDVGLEFFLAYVRAYLLSGREELWDTAVCMARACGLGELGKIPAQGANVNIATSCSHVQAVFALAELYVRTGCRQYLELCGAVCNNIEAKHFNAGYYNHGAGYRYAKFDFQYPLALLTYHAAAAGKYELAPVYLNGSGFIHGNYYPADGTVLNVKDNDYIYKVKL
jgi:pectate lyase